MHAARLKMEVEPPAAPPQLKQSIHVGCSGWRYWKWRDSFYAEVPQPDWFEHYLKSFDTVEINASFYSWPTVAGVQAWRRQPGKKKFVYTVKVCEHITHIKKFKGTKTLIRDFGMIADILGDRMGCFLFQLPPSYRCTKTRLNDIVSQLDPARRNVVEFRHASWWNEEVYSAFRKQALYSAPAAAQDYRMTSSGRPTDSRRSCSWGTRCAPTPPMIVRTRTIRGFHQPLRPVVVSATSDLHDVRIVEPDELAIPADAVRMQLVCRGDLQAEGFSRRSLRPGTGDSGLRGEQACRLLKGTYFEPRVLPGANLYMLWFDPVSGSRR